MWVYDPKANDWEAKPRGFEDERPWKGQVKAFYGPVLNVHVYHVAGGSRPGGMIRVYCWKAAAGKRPG